MTNYYQHPIYSLSHSNFINQNKNNSNKKKLNFSSNEKTIKIKESKLNIIKNIVLLSSEIALLRVADSGPKGLKDTFSLTNGLSTFAAAIIPWIGFTPTKTIKIKKEENENLVVKKSLLKNTAFDFVAVPILGLTTLIAGDKKNKNLNKDNNLVKYTMAFTGINGAVSIINNLLVYKNYKNEKIKTSKKSIS